MSTFQLQGATSNYLSKREATGQGGLITGTNPVAFTTADPLRLWIVQVGIIIITAQLLSLGLRRLRQPKVIAEVLAGILLGPTAFGSIPGFTERIFPSVSLPYLSLVANIGLCLFHFLIGLEIDTGVVKRNACMSVIVSLIGIALPFGLGTALSVPLYHHFIDSSVPLTYFLVFTGVAYSVTAFPVLCRILTELKLLDTNVGIIALSAGVGNNIVGWTLLALSVALVNTGSGLSAVWILLCCIAFTIFLLFPVKFLIHWFAHKTGSTENHGPSMLYMTVVMILVWACAFFTDSIGMNAIFGAFLAGLVIPREGDLAIKLAEKLEDIVSIVFLPLYFTLTGLNTNLWLLNNGLTWAFTIAIIVFSFSGKFGGCMIASKVAGCGWRESGTIGALMSCKGLIELIVLNVGLQAGIISQRVFAMFILEALTLTFITTPLVTILYPPERRVRVRSAGLSVEGDGCGEANEKASIIYKVQPWRHRFMVVLNKLDHIPGAMALTQLILPPRNSPEDVALTTTTSGTTDKLTIPEVSVEALQLIELSDRTSAMMKLSATDGPIRMDPVLGMFRMFGELNGLGVTTSMSVVPYDDFVLSVAEYAKRHAPHLVLLPWLLPAALNAVDTSDVHGSGGCITPKSIKGPPKPFDNPFSSSLHDKCSWETYSKFVRGVFAESKTDVAVFIDVGDWSGVLIGESMHVFLPFFGGADDRLALEFVVQLCLNPRMTATVVRMIKCEEMTEKNANIAEESSMVNAKDRSDPDDPLGLTIQYGNGPMMMSRIDSICVPPTPQTRHKSENADNVSWLKYTNPSSDTNPALRQALSHIHFSDMQTSTPVDAAIQRARMLARETSQHVLIIAGRSKRVATENHLAEVKRVLEMHSPGWAVDVMRPTVGDVGAAMVLSGVGAVVVVQAAEEILECKGAV